MRRILNLFKKKARIKTSQDFKSEAEYYQYLFTKNQTWSSKLPNSDEFCRWNAILAHIHFVKGIKWKEQNSSDFNIIDLGAGRGWMTNYLAAFGNVIGIEPVRPVVEYAKKLFPGLEFRQGYLNQHSKELGSRGINLIVSTEVLEHVRQEDRKLFCVDIWNSLSENGYLIITSPRKEIQNQWEKVYGLPGQPVEDWMNTDEVKSLFEENKFKALNYIGVKLPHLKNFAEVEVYQSWLFKKEF